MFLFRGEKRCFHDRPPNQGSHGGVEKRNNVPVWFPPSSHALPESLQDLVLTRVLETAQEVVRPLVKLILVLCTEILFDVSSEVSCGFATPTGPKAHFCPFGAVVGDVRFPSVA